MRINPNGLRFLAAVTAALLAGLMLLAFTGCPSKSASNASEDNTPQQSSPTSNPSADHFDGGTYCVQTFIQGAPPAQPLHFSNKVTESDPTLKTKDFEADLSGDTLDLVHRDRWLATDEDRKFFEESRKFTDPKIIVRAINNGFAEETVTNHASRSDQVSWSGILTGIAQGGTPWGLFIFKPAVSRAGDETVNGYDTVKYTVDTTGESDAQKSPGFLRNLKDYNIRGTAWVLKGANCVLQYDITDEQTGTDGKLRTTHYEGTVTKK